MGKIKIRTADLQPYTGCTSIRDVIVMLKWCHHVASIHLYQYSSVFRIFLKTFSCFFQYKMRYLVMSKKQIYYFCEDGIENLSLKITVCHNSASLMMKISNPWDRFFYPTLKLMMDSYIHTLGMNIIACVAVVPISVHPAVISYFMTS